MKQFLLTTLALLLLATAGNATEDTKNNHYYVTVDGEGEGTSWKDASNDLQAVLAIAEEGDAIWVAAGTYIPTNSDDRNISFVIPQGVAVYGGFAGKEKKFEDRDVIANVTTLSGNIGQTEEIEDNSYTVVYFKDVTSSTVLDGFQITGGHADGLVEGVDRSTCGAGIFLDGDAGEASPTIKNCNVFDNYSREGAGLYNFANEGVTAPIISDCSFADNRSDFNGGAIFNDGNFGSCNPTFTNCRFTDNESMYGAGILNRGLYGECTPVLTDCTFTNNFSIVRGGAIYNQREGRGICEAQLESCVFEDNASTVGKGGVDQTRRGDEAEAAPRRSGVRKRSTEAISY